MSHHAVSSSSKDSAQRSRRGQSLVEFALVLPILVVLLLGVADFGRVFHAGIVTEAAARNAAEAAAQEYLQLRRATTAMTASDFDRVHDVALATICDEAQRLPGRATSGGVCTMPAAGICIHDDPGELAAYGPRCGADAATAPTECGRLHSLWPSTPPATGSLPWVEVRVCYEFTTLFNLQALELPFGWGLSIGDIWLQRDRSFTVADY